ncbi:MAG: pyruvate kinase [Pseudomonadaceae bacterium]|nr:pyruvate kinase [Pseudomonadaceae bacterium]
MTAFRHTKIMPTLGPSSWDEATIEALVQAGAAAFRLNFSHGNADRHRETFANIKSVAAKLGRHIPILQDLQGPKIRIGTMAEPVELKVGDVFTLDDNTEAGSASRVCLPHADILAALRAGDTISLNDGVIRMSVTEAGTGFATCAVQAGGLLSSCKGVNVPGRELPLNVLTEKDLADLQVGLEMGVDWVALSFVQKAEDIAEARRIIGDKALIMSKIETQAAIRNLEGIIAASDAIMIARGDLGVELPPEDVPPLQRQMISLCRAMGKPAVVATQMLESMIQNPVPTRAEASDVAAAAYEGVDAVMLSAESASGKHPVAAVEVMARIVAKAEASSGWNMRAPEPEAGNVADATCHAACTTAASIGAACVVAFTETGGTVLRMARNRPSQPIICLTPHNKVARQMALLWGVHTVVCPDVQGTDDMVQKAVAAVKTTGLAHTGECIVITAGVPFGKAGTTNMMRVAGV